MVMVVPLRKSRRAIARGRLNLRRFERGARSNPRLSFEAARREAKPKVYCKSSIIDGSMLRIVDRYLARELLFSFIAALLILLLVVTGATVADLLNKIAHGRVAADLLARADRIAHGRYARAADSAVGVSRRADRVWTPVSRKRDGGVRRVGPAGDGTAAAARAVRGSDHRADRTGFVLARARGRSQGADAAGRSEPLADHRGSRARPLRRAAEQRRRHVRREA